MSGYNITNNPPNFRDLAIYAKTAPNQELNRLDVNELHVNGTGSFNSSVINCGFLNATGSVTAPNITQLEQKQPLKYMNSMMSNIQSVFQIDNNKFHVEITADGTLKVVPTLVSSYQGTVEVLNNCEVIASGSDIQSAYYACVLFHCLVNPADALAFIRSGLGIQTNVVILGQNLDMPTVYYAYVKKKLLEMEVKGTLPVVFLSICEAILKAANTAYDILLPDYKPWVDVRAFKPIDILAAIIINMAGFGIEIGFYRGPEAQYWWQFLKMFNGINVAGIPNDYEVLNGPDANFPSPSMSSYMGIGKDYISDGKGVLLGSTHFQNIGNVHLETVRFKVPSQNIDFRNVLFGGCTPAIVFGASNDQCNFERVITGTETCKYYFQVKLEKDPTAEFTSTGSIQQRNDAFTHYYIGNVLHPIEFEGPLMCTFGRTFNKFGYTGGSTVQCHVPRTKYGPIIAWATTGAFTINARIANNASSNTVYGGTDGQVGQYTLQPGYALCTLDFIDSGLTQSMEMQFRANANGIVNTVDDWINLDKKYGVKDAGFPGYLMAFDKNGEMVSTTYQPLFKPDNAYLPEIERASWNPSSDADIQFTNFSIPNWRVIILNGSDPEIATSFIQMRSGYQVSELSNSDQTYWAMNKVGTVINANSNIYNCSPVAPIYPQLSSIVGYPNIRFLLENIGTGPTGNYPLEYQRTTDLAGYYQLMRQAQLYQINRDRAYWNFSALYRRLGLLTYDAKGQVSVNQNLNNWKAPGKITQANAESISIDTAMYAITPYWKEMLEAIKTGAAAGINWTKPYFNQLSTTAALQFTGTAYQTFNAYIAYTGSAYSSLQSTINSILPNIVTLLDNWNPLTAFDMNSVGTFIITQMLYRAMDRTSRIRYNYIARQQQKNSIYNGKPFIKDTSTAGAVPDNYHTAMVQGWARNKYDYVSHSCPNFTCTNTGTNNQIWTKQRELTTDDQWQIFINRMTYPNGFNATGAFDISDPTNLLQPQTPIELIMDALVDALVDINQLDTTWTLSYVNADRSITEVVSTATTLLEKASRPWGSINTFVFPYDVDGSGNLRLYPTPYGQNRMFGSGIYELRDGGNLSYASNIAGLTYNVTGASCDNGYYANGQQSTRRIWQDSYPQNGPNRLYKNGYTKQTSGTLSMRLTAARNGTDLYEGTIPLFNLEPLTNSMYQYNIYCMQNKIFPNTSTTTSQYTFNTISYNRTNFLNGIKAKTNAIGNCI